MSDGFSLTVEAGIGHLRLMRAERLNALTAEMMDALTDRCRAVERRDDIDVLILSGEGRAFCAGGDIDAWGGQDPRSFARHWVRDGHAAFDALARLRQPVIAVLDGHALGGGLELAACADYRIAEAQVKIGQPETGLGIIPGWSGTQRAVRRFGARAVRRMALFGEVFTAEEARALGLVDRVVPGGEGMAAAQALAAQVLSHAPEATELTKMLVNAAEGEERGRVLESLAGRIAAGGAELAEGLSAFRARRPPDHAKKPRPPKGPRMIRHIAHMRFAPGTTAAQKLALYERFAALSGHIDGILDFQHRMNVSVETQLMRGFNDMFWIDFRNLAARDAYLEDPAHHAIGAEIVAMLDGGLDGLFVCDIEV